jgi:hypothetical protein
MGSWSVYCNISQIAITAGNKCVLLPIKVNHGEYGYTPYLPATLPIFGKYNDYGGIEKIEENDSTKLIEEHFGITIQEFADIFPDWLSYQREEMKPIVEKMKNFKEIEKWKYMWIDREVWDFMSTHLNKDSKGHLDFGNKGILELLGFEYVGETDKSNDNLKRYHQIWKFDEKNFYSDGNWIQNEKGNAVYYFDKGYSNQNTLTKMIKVPEDKMWMANKATWQLWKYVTKGKAKEMLGWIIGRRSYGDDDMMELIARQIAKENPELGEKVLQRNPIVYKTIAEKYVNDFEKFGDGLAELVTVRNNMHPMSGSFNPHILYLTPQCGEYNEHQVLLDKFAEINKKQVSEEDEDDDE